ncbi:MAG: hypothetical protein MJ172_11170 [Clostridia bacterium]|nr:hypothetical protein [Clostridia bacterium]
MRKHDFINILSERTGITIDEATSVNDIIEAHSLIGKNSKEAATFEIAEVLGVDYNRADEISNTSYSIIGEAMLNKIKHPFGSDED